MPKTVSYVQWFLEPYSIGMKLRTLRTQKRLTLKRLAIETGLSTALLSKMETDRMTPTLATLATVCRIYGVGLGYFFSDSPRHTLSITRKAHLQGDGRGTDPVKTTALNAVAGSAPLQARMIELAPGGAISSISERRESSGLAYVLEGRLQLEAGGVHEVLEAGDCVCVESPMALGWSAAGKHSCRILAVTCAARG